MDSSPAPTSAVAISVTIVFVRNPISVMTTMIGSTLRSRTILLKPDVPSLDTLRLPRKFGIDLSPSLTKVNASGDGRA